MTTATLERPPKPCGCPPTAVLGQKVKIMEGITNAGAGGQRVHIAEGVGNWALGRSSQTVHIRPVEEVGCECGITDSFDRTEVDGWGRSDIGWDWFIGDEGPLDPQPDAYSVSGGWAYADETLATSSPEIRLSAFTNPYGLDVTFRFQERTDYAPTDTSAWWFYFADGLNIYGIRMLTEDPDPMSLTAFSHPSSDSASPTYVRGDIYRIRIEFLGSQVSARIWADGDAEPGTWDVQIGAAGTPHPDFTGHRFFVPYRISEFDAADWTTCTYDNFERAAASDWGDSMPYGATYAYPFGIPGGVLMSVDDGVGIVEMDNTFGMTIRLPEESLWTGSDGFVMTYDFLIGAVPGTGDRVSIDLYNVGGVDATLDFVIQVSSDPTEGGIQLYGGAGSDNVAKTDWVADTWYRAKLEYRPSSVVRARVWPRDDAEPEPWDATTPCSAFPLAEALELVPDNNSGGDYTLKFDNITFNVCPEEVVG